MARLAVSVDSRASLVALQALSEVKLDAGGSSGTGLRDALDFGDGQGVDAATAQHIYLAGGRNRILDITVQTGTGFSSDASRFTVMAHGGSASGFALTFSH